MPISSALGSSALLPAGLGFRNKIINGDMAISQRGTSAIPNVAATNTYGTDRWHVYGELGSKMTITQTTSNSNAVQGFPFSTLVTSSAATTPVSSHYYGVRQIIEGSNIADLAWGTSGAKPVVVSFWVRSSIAGTYSLALFNSGNNRTLISAYTISAIDTWEKKTVYINAGETTGTWGTGNGIGVNVWFDLGSGTGNNGTAGVWNTSLLTRTSGSVNWIGTSGATFYITGVQLEQNYQPTPFEQRPIGVELQLCQRYFAKSFDQGVAPFNGSQTANDGGNDLQVWNTTVANSYCSFIKTPVPMRARPNVVFYNAEMATANTWSIYNASGQINNAYSVVAGSVNQKGFLVYAAGISTITVSNGAWTVSAEL